MSSPSISVRNWPKPLSRASQRRQSYPSRQYATSACSAASGEPCDQSSTVSFSVEIVDLVLRDGEREGSDCGHRAHAIGALPPLQPPARSP